MSARNVRTVLVAVAVLVLGAGLARSQTPFAATNIGQRIRPDDARVIARGGWGMAVADTTHPGFKNQASLTYLRHVALRYTGYGERTTSTTASGERKTAEVYSPGIQVALPIVKTRLSFTAGFNMFGSTRWDTSEPAVWLVDGEEIKGDKVSTRQGTRFNVPLGVAWRPFGGFSFAGSVNLESGSVLEQYTELFAAGTGLSENILETRNLYEGTSYTLSALWVPFDRLHLGASWTPAYDLDVDRTAILSNVTVAARSTSQMRIADEYRAGLQLRLIRRWQIGADIQYMPMTEASLYAPWQEEAEDEYTLGVGLERLKARERRAGLRNLPLRLGANLHRWGYRFGGEPVDELTFSIGTGFALANDLGQLDMAFSYGVIGDLEKNGAESTVYRLGISLTGLEAWW
ncbi:hypothetical protein KDM41_00020 [bacterium]|nr:hypothetical protein [bacterium]